MAERCLVAAQRPVPAGADVSYSGVSGADDGAGSVPESLRGGRCDLDVGACVTSEGGRTTGGHPTGSRVAGGCASGGCVAGGRTTGGCTAGGRTTGGSSTTGGWT